MSCNLVAGHPRALRGLTAGSQRVIHWLCAERPHSPHSLCRFSEVSSQAFPLCHRELAVCCPMGSAGSPQAFGRISVRYPRYSIYRYILLCSCVCIILVPVSFQVHTNEFAASSWRRKEYRPAVEITARLISISKHIFNM